MEGWTNTDRLAERPYPPTPLRLEEAARRGLSPRSADLVTATGGLAGLLALAWLGGRLTGQLTEAFRGLLGAGRSPLAPLAESGQDAWGALAPLAATAAMAALIVFGAAAAGGIVQGGWRVVLGRARPDWGRLSLRGGLGRLASRRAFIGWAFAAAKLAAVLVVAAAAARSATADIVRSWRLDPAGILQLACGLAFDMGLKVLIVLALIAVADYLCQRWQFRRDLRMTRREFLDDLKRMEGDPAVRRRRRQVAAIAAGAAPWRLARASVLVACEDGRAVALQFLAGGRASRVVARADRRAGRAIRESAAAEGIPVLADDRLAAVLFGRCGLGTIAPRTAHRTVAEFLRARGPRPQGMAALEGPLAPVHRRRGSGS